MLAPGIGNAAIVTFESITGTWSNATGNPATYSGDGTANPTVHWGEPYASGTVQSGYDLATVGALTVDSSQLGLFDLGAFTHENFPLSSGTGINGLQLTLTALISIDGGEAFWKSFVYDFQHYETPNWYSDNPDALCADGGANYAGVNVNGCADRIRVVSSELSDSFVVDGMGYTLGIAGFQQGGDLASDFWSSENMANLATLKGEFVALGAVEGTAVPEPFSLAIFGTALLGLGGVVYRRR